MFFGLQWQPEVWWSGRQYCYDLELVQTEHDSTKGGNATVVPSGSAVESYQ